MFSKILFYTQNIRLTITFLLSTTSTNKILTISMSNFDFFSTKIHYPSLSKSIFHQQWTNFNSKNPSFIIKKIPEAQPKIKNTNTKPSLYQKLKNKNIKYFIQTFEHILNKIHLAKEWFFILKNYLILLDF